MVVVVIMYMYQRHRTWLVAMVAVEEGGAGRGGVLAADIPPSLLCRRMPTGALNGRGRPAKPSRHDHQDAFVSAKAASRIQERGSRRARSPPLCAVSAEAHLQA